MTVDPTKLALVPPAFSPSPAPLCSSGLAANNDVEFLHAPTPAQALSAVREGSAAKIPYSILVLDDESGILRALKRAAGDIFITVHTAQTPEAAAKILEEHPEITMVLSDYNIDPRNITTPYLTWLDFVKEVLEQRPNLRIAFNSGNARDLQQALNEEGKSWPVLEKPYNAGDLRTFLRAAANV